MLKIVCCTISVLESDEVLLEGDVDDEDDREEEEDDIEELEYENEDRVEEDQSLVSNTTFVIKSCDGDTDGEAAKYEEVEEKEISESKETDQPASTGEEEK